MTTRTAILWKTVLISTVLAAAHAQTTPEARPGVTLQTTTTLVQVRVIAHDAKGHPVTDLKQEDFEILDDGQTRKIAVFAADTAASATAPKAGAPAAPSAFPEDKPAPLEQDHGYAAVVLDYLNSGYLPAIRARGEVERLLKAFDPAGKASLYALNFDELTELGDFGTDRDALIAKIGKTIGHPSPCPDNPSIEPQSHDLVPRPPLLGPPPAMATAIPKDIHEARCEQGVRFFLYQRDLKTVDMLERFADRLSFVPGRKALIWVTTASDVHSYTDNIKNFIPAKFRALALADYPLPRQPEMDARIEQAIRKLNNADVGLYTVDSCGIDSPADVCDSHHEVMEDFAKRTGGMAFPRTNDLAGAMQAAAEDVRTTYSLAFYASPGVDLSKFHQLKVRVNRPGVTLNYRQGYSLGSALPAASLAKELPGAEARALRAKALAAPVIFKELEALAASPAMSGSGASLTAPHFYIGPNLALADMVLEIGVDNLKFTNAAGRQTAELNFAVEALRPDGAVAAKFTDTRKVSFANDAEAAAFLKQPYRYERQFRLAPGKYEIRVAFGSGQAGLGRAATPLTVDGWDGKALALSGIALARETRKADAAAAALEARKALISGATEVVPTGNTRFKRGEPCKAYFEIYDPARASASAAPVSVQLRILDESGAQKVDSGPFAIDALAKPGDETMPISLNVPIDGLAPGKYKLEVRALRPNGDPLIREAPFAVD
jgi:VWFA-related protein